MNRHEIRAAMSRARHEANKGKAHMPSPKDGKGNMPHTHRGMRRGFNPNPKAAS